MPKSECRTYTVHIHNGPHVLVTWRQRRCCICQKYLGKHQQKHCYKCARKQRLEYSTEKFKEWRIKNREYYNERRRKWRKLRKEKEVKKIHAH